MGEREDGHGGISRCLTLGIADWMHCSRRLSLSEELSPESLRLGRWPEAWRSFLGSSPGMDSVERSEMEAAWEMLAGVSSVQ